MKFDCVGVLYRKEMIDFLRDKRTIFAMFVAPIIIMPVSMIGTTTFIAKERDTAKVQRYKIGLRETAPIPGVRDAISKAGFTIKDVADPRASADSKSCDFGVDVVGSTVTIYSDQSEISSQVAKMRIRDALDTLRDQRVRDDLAKLNVPASVLSPFRVSDVNLAKPRKMTGAIIGGMVGFILVIILFNGAMYLAVDTTAGEKERKTLEMLLSSAASREEIVVGKALASVTTSFCSAVLTLASFLSGFVYLQHSQPQLSRSMDVPIDFATMAMVVASTLPMCVLAAGCAIALATPAKSVREAMSYLTLILFIPIFLGVITMLPGMDKKAIIDIIPIANFVRLIRLIMLGDWQWSNFAIVFAANVIFATAAAWTAVRRFKDERILFRT